MQSSFTPHGAPIRDAKLLPVQPPAHVIGRNRELASMHVTIKAGSAVFLSGTPGIGKTALASVLASAYIASNSGGVLWFHILEDDLEQLIARVGRAYGVNTFSGDDPTATIAKVVDLLKEHRPLVVLDGMIDLEAARDFVRQCASGIPLLITNELAGAGPWTPISLKPLTEADSQTLLHIYANVEPEPPSPDIQGLSKFIGGVPLAIELAGRLLVAEELTPAELLAALPSTTVQDSLGTMLALVFKRLQAPVQGMLVVLAAMFSGAATAELVSDLSNAPASAFIPLMRQLTARGLAHERIVYGQFAYVLHEAVQNYAREWLNNVQRLPATENRAMQSVATYVDRHAHNTPLDHDRLAAEIDNIVGAAAYATETGQREVVRKLIEAIEERAGDFVTVRNFQPEAGHLNRLATLLLPRAAVEVAEPPLVQNQAPATAEVIVPEPVAEAPIEPPAESPESPELSESVTENAVEVPPPLEPVSLFKTLQERLAIARAASDKKSEAVLLNALGRYYVDEGNMTEARNFYKRAIDAYGVVQDFDGAQSALDAMLIIGTQTDDSEDTLRYIKRCIQLAEQTGGDIGQKGRLLTRQGDLQLAKGDINAAVDSFQKAVAALRETDDAVTTGLALSRLGEAYIQQNRIDEGIDTLDSAIVLFHDEHFPGFESKALSTIGNTYLQHQQWAKAEKYDQRALSIAHDQLDQPGEAAQLAALGHLRELQSDPQGAIDYYAQALYVVYVYGSKDLQAKYAFELGRLLVDDTRTLSRGMQLLTESDNLAPSNETKRLLSRANKRSERLTSAGIPQPPAEGAIRDYVGEIYERADAALSSDKVN